MIEGIQRLTRLGIRGKFFIRDGEIISVNAVTYGPFPSPLPDHHEEFLRIVKAGFNAIRVYEEPTTELMRAAMEHGLMVFAGVHWQWSQVFRGMECERFFIDAKMKLADLLEKWGGCEALVGCYVANEIPSDIARWIGPVKVRESLEELIDFCQARAPQVLIGYANYPSSEYLEPGNADFTGFNIYLEDRGKFSHYLPRLHHLAGDRPVLISEFGLDARTHGVENLRETMLWFRQESLDAGMAGTTIFAWSDRWRVEQREVEGWEFGLTGRKSLGDNGGDRNGDEKFSLSEIAAVTVSDFPKPMISVIICVYNGVHRVARAIESLAPSVVRYANYEVIVVDDGSTDGTQELVKNYDDVKLICAEHGGLSKARNLGADAAIGDIFAYTDDDCEVDPDWLFWIAKGYSEQEVDALGGPNLPPIPLDEDEAVVAAAPGAPSHVMLSDKEAEHIAGCNLSVRREAFFAVGGFSEVYQVAGDDVDFCWKLEKAGYKIGFHGAAFVWHRRRTSLLKYFKQQIGYGKAEALLMRDYPEKFSRGMGPSWKGCVYTGLSLGSYKGSFIYHGKLGLGGYQQVVTTMMPIRKLHPMFDQWSARCKLELAKWLQPKMRRWSRCWYSRAWSQHVKVANHKKSQVVQKESVVIHLKEVTVNDVPADARARLLESLIHEGWSEDETAQEWDVSHSKCKILVAQETIADGHWRLKIRLGSEPCKTAEVTMESIVDLVVKNVK